MNGGHLPEISDVSAEIRTSLRQLQADNILLISPGTWLAAFLLIANTARFQDPLQGGVAAMILFVLPVIVLALRKLGYLPAVWTLVLGLVAVDLLLVLWAGVDAAICLIALPVGLVAIFVNPAGGALAAAGCTFLLMWVPAISRVATPTLRVFTLLGVWGTIGLIWLTRRPLLAQLHWSWSSYARNRLLLEQARDTQLQVKQALQDLADANLQLARLNSLAQALRRDAEEARRAKEEFVANVSHELRTPLNMIIGFSEMILEAPETYGRNIPPALLADLAVIHSNSQHLSSLIDDVLDLSQIEVGQMSLTRERTALREIVEAAAIAVRPLFEAKGLYLEIEISEDLPLIYCDRTRIREVVLNLLSNAGRFTERGGVRVWAWRESKEIVVSVADTGPGIAEEDRGRLFQPFQQLASTVRQRFGGTGLGLSISRNFIEMHGGRIWLESEIGEGTTFFFALPIDLPAPAHGGPRERLVPDWEYRQRTRASSAPIGVARPRLVVLEDGDSLQRLLVRYLDGVEIVPVASLKQAIREVSDVPAQALLVNCSSLGESMQYLSDASGVLPYGTPLIVSFVPGVSEAAASLGTSDYLVKPVSRGKLLEALERAQLPGKTVLIVDDEPEALRLFWRMLASADHGYRVLTTDDGREAMQILREQHPDVVLLDLVMPDMDGFQFLAAKTEDPALRDIPVIVISALDPVGHPIVSSALTVTCRGGLSVRQLLDSIDSLSRALAPTGLPSHPRPTAVQPA